MPPRQLAPLSRNFPPAVPLTTIGKLLGSAAELKTLSARMRRMHALQTLYSRCAPPELAGSSRVKNYRAATLVVAADNSAVAAKLKHLAPSLLASLRESDAEITAIRIEVQVKGSARNRPGKSNKTALSADALERFDELAKRVPDGDLKAALGNLVRHHRPRKD
jgi:hypothetical protein